MSLLPLGKMNYEQNIFTMMIQHETEFRNQHLDYFFVCSKVERASISFEIILFH